MEQAEPDKPAKIPLPYKLSTYEFAGLIDHTLLKHDAAESDIKRLCGEAIKYNFVSVCIRPYHAKLAKKELAGSNVKVCTVISFDDEGTSIVKPDEAKRAIEYGVDELDVVMNYRALKNSTFSCIQKDLEAVVVVAMAKEKLVKVILETAALSEYEVTTACRIAKAAGADFVKTSTGKIQGANPDVVSLMRYVVGNKFGIKASGGIKTLENALPLVEAGMPKKEMLGYFRLGTSSGVSLIEEYKKLIGASK